MIVTYDFTNYTDVALYKPAHQSSLSKWSTVLGARGVLQLESMDREFSFHTSRERKPWWYVDLVCSYSISYIVIFDRVGYSRRSNSLKVEASLDLNTWEVIHEGLIHFNLLGQPLILPLSGEIKSRYIRLSIKNSDEDVFFHLRKVSVLVNNNALKEGEGLSNGNIANLPSYRNRLNKLDVSILGTSNSIMKGYVSALSQLDCNILQNVSVGSSHSSVIAYRLKDLEKIEFDYLIIDIFVNEDKALSQGFDLGDTTEGFLKYVKLWCAKRSVIPIILIMPTNFNENNLFLEKTIQWCKKHGLIFFNGFKFLEKFCNVYDRSLRSCFSDPAHITIFMSRLLGITLNETLLDLSFQDMRGKSAFKESKYDGDVFQYLPISNYKFPKVERKTSVMLENFLVFLKDDKLAINIEKECTLQGVVINMAKSHGILKIETMEGGFTKRLDNNYYDKDRDLWLVVWNLQKGFKLPSGQVELSCIDLDETAISLCNEDNDHRSGSTKNNPIRLEIAGLIIKYPTNQTVFKEKKFKEPDLVSRVNDNFLKNIF